MAQPAPPQAQPAPIIPQIAVQTGLAAMPVLGSKEAPRLFDGKPEDLEDFLDRFLILAAGAQLTDDEKVKAITQYVTRKQKALFESLDGYSTRSWTDFEDSLKAVFPSTATEQKYSPITLESISLKAAQTYRSSYDEFLEYFRNFMPVAKWLITKNKLTTNDQNRLFWFGLHPQNRSELKPEMRRQFPTHDRTLAWPMENVMTVAQSLYNPLEFDNEPPPFRSVQKVPARDFDADELLDDRTRLINAAAAETMKPSQRQIQIQQAPVQQIPVPIQQPQVVTKTVSFVPRNQSSDDALVDLVGRMAELSVNDKNYAVAYAQLYTRFPDFAKNMPAPRPHVGGYYVNNQGQTVRANQQFVQQPGSSFYAPAKSPRLCFFCNRPAPECFGIKSCKEVAEYVKMGKILYDGISVKYPNGNRVATHPNGMKAAVDEFHQWQASQTAKSSPQFFFAAQTQSSDTQKSFAHIVEEREPKGTIDTDFEAVRKSMSENAPFVGAYNTRSQTRAEPNRWSKRAVPTGQENMTQTATNTQQTLTSQPPVILKRPTGPENKQTVETVLQKFMNGSIRLDNSELLAVSPALQERLKDFLGATKVRTEETQQESQGVQLSQAFASLPCATASEEVRQIEIELPKGIQVGGIWDTASAIVGINKDLAIKTGHPINWGRITRMQNADGSYREFKGVAEHFPIKIGSIISLVDAVIAEDSPYDVLLGLPWIKHVNGALFIRNGEFVAEICNPQNYHHKLEVTVTQHRQLPCHAHSAPVNLFLKNPPVLSIGTGEFSLRIIQSTYPFDSPSFITRKYKKVEHKVRPVPTTTPEHAKIIRRMVGDPLVTLNPLSPHPKPFQPTERLTETRWKELAIGSDGFLWLEEINLAAEVLALNNAALAWEDSERGQFRSDMFPDVKIATVEHVPWAERAIPIPPGIEQEFMEQIYKKLSTGVYELSNSSYRSRIFTVAKKSGAIRIVHDLQKLNSVTIKDAGLPPPIEQFAEWYAGKSIYTLMDIYVGYDHRILDERSRDLTTFQTPIGTFRLTSLPMGWTNSVPIFQGDVAFILRDEYNTARNFIDDIPVAGPSTRYELPEGGYETIPENPGIRRFVWEHFTDVNRILHRFKHAGLTVSAKKLFFGVPAVIIVGHKCTYEGRLPEDTQVEKIKNWPRPTNVSEVRGFLGVTGVVRIFIKGYATIAKPLVQLTRKDIKFIWGEEQEKAMQELKLKVTSAPCLKPIDYASGRRVILSVDSSVIAVGWILSQLNEEGKKVPAKHGSITWNDVEARYSLSQPKLEIYGLFRALKANRLYLIGLPRFTVEMDAESVKGMINNPDIAPTAVINRWIAGIKMFDFDLVHVPAMDFKGPDGMSRRPLAEGEKKDDEDVDAWLEDTLGLGLWAETWRGHEPGADAVTITRNTNHAILYSRTYVVSYAYQLANTSGPSSYVLSHSDSAVRRDKELENILHFLKFLARPSDLSDEEYDRIIKKSRRFYFKDDSLWRRQDNGYNQKVVFYPDRLELLIHAHDRLGHKGKNTVAQALSDRFWWPTLINDVKDYLKTCHECQLRTVDKFYIPPTITIPATLFSKVHIDTMMMPASHGKRYLVQARDSLTSYVEWRALVNENGRNLANFILEELLTRWGSVQEIVTDNGTPYLAALAYLSAKFSITHIRISGYNSQANGVVERTHRTIRDALVKTCQGDIKKWLDVAPFVFWADRVTTRKSTGLSPFYMAHGIEPVLPFDIVHATYLVPKLDKPLTTADLIAIRARQLQRRDSDLAMIAERVAKSRYQSIEQFRKEHTNRIREQNFKPGTLVLVRNIRMEKDLSAKHLPRYYGPMVVISKTKKNSYRLGELDGSISIKGFAGYRLIPYYPRDPSHISVTQVFAPEDLQQVTVEEELAIEDEEDREYAPRRRSARLAQKASHFDNDPEEIDEGTIREQADNGGNVLDGDATDGN
jgi:transposase InsO family protein